MKLNSIELGVLKDVCISTQLAFTDSSYTYDFLMPDNIDACVHLKKLGLITGDIIESLNYQCLIFTKSRITDKGLLYLKLEQL